MDTYNICESNLKNLEEAVDAILKIRDNESPFDLSVSLRGAKVDGDIFHCHDTDFVMLESAKRSLNDMFKIPLHLHDQLSPKVMSLVYNDLLEKRSNSAQLTLRCVKDAENKQYIRVLMPSKHGIVDDAVLLRHIAKKFPQGSQVSIRHAWTARTHSSIRVMFNDVMPKATELVGADARFGFDILNSEIIPNMTCIKGILEFTDADNIVSCFIVPKLLLTLSSSDKADISAAIKRYTEFKNDGIDELVCESIAAGNMLEESSRAKHIRHLYEQKILMRRDVLELYGHMDGRARLAQAEDLIRDDNSKTTLFTLAFMIGTFASTMDSYLKRSQLEFIPNLWFGRTRK